jgi:hypothetical protein
MQKPPSHWETSMPLQPLIIRTEGGALTNEASLMDKCKHNKVNIKIENLEWHNFSRKLDTVMSGKKKISAMINTISDMHTKLQVLAKKDDGLKTRVATAATLEKALHGYVEDTKKDLLLWQEITKDDQVDIKKLCRAPWNS